jgi:hypothetical protein
MSKPPKKQQDSEWKGSRDTPFTVEKQPVHGWPSPRDEVAIHTRDMTQRISYSAFPPHGECDIAQ